MRARVIAWASVSALVALFGWLIFKANAAMNEYTDWCTDQGGTVESRYEYSIPQSTTVDGVTTTTDVPVYSYHCWVNGVEV